MNNQGLVFCNELQYTLLIFVFDYKTEYSTKFRSGCLGFIWRKMEKLVTCIVFLLGFQFICKSEQEKALWLMQQIL
jgi:ABC-type polysaccharide/polyol phosphate export permease